MNKCKECDSHAINPGRRGRDDSDLDLCDACYWRVRAERLQAIVDAYSRRFARLNGIVDAAIAAEKVRGE